MAIVRKNIQKQKVNPVNKAVKDFESSGQHISKLIPTMRSLNKDLKEHTKLLIAERRRGRKKYDIDTSKHVGLK